MQKLHSFQQNEEDVELLKGFHHLANKLEFDNSKVDYDNLIVKKPWGYEYLALDNSQVAIWVLHISRKRKTSMHCHPTKTTSLVVLTGRVECSSLRKKITMEQLEAVVIEKGCFHSTEASSESKIVPSSENGAWVMEIEAPSKKLDLVRANDMYGRAGMTYEGLDNMVTYNKDRLKLCMPSNGETLRQYYMGCIFEISVGDSSIFAGAVFGLISVIEYRGEILHAIPNVKVGSIYEATNLLELVRGYDASRYVFLRIFKDLKMLKLSDYVASFIEGLGVKEVFGVSGGGAMHLIDSVGKNKNLIYVATHHEQAAAMAAEAYSRISGMGVGLFTTGPGGTNALTGVACAWVDSIPTFFISGQVTRDTLIGDTGLRQFGVQESDIVTLVKSITKYSVCITDENNIRYELEKAAYISKTGRPGPVWIDIPLDIQSKQINPNELKGFVPPNEDILINKNLINSQLKIFLSMLNSAERPVIICGYGVRLAGAIEEFRKFVEVFKIPVVSSWTASDLLDTSNQYYVGRSGIFGDRASNFAVQNSDLLLILGSRMSVPQVGYNFRTFARAAKIVMVDIDQLEISKSSLHVDLGVVADVKQFINNALLLQGEIGKHPAVPAWVNCCQKWKAQYPVILPEYAEQKSGVNSFYFIDLFSKKLAEDAVIITDMGTAFTCTMQAFNVRLGQRLTTASGHAPMGYGLPGAVGACLANGRRKTICISGDGGLQMNIQELQTIVHLKLPILIFILNNGGYLTIKHMQQNHFGRYVGAEINSGVSCPDLLKIATAYGIPASRIMDQETLRQELDSILDKDGPYICEIMMPEDQPLIPRLSSLKRPDGTIISKPLEDLFPFLEREEFQKNMIIKPLEVLE